MQSPLDLHLLVDKYAARLPEFELNSDDREEDSTTPLSLQNQVKSGTPNETFVDRCLNYLKAFESSKPAAA